ncbi:MAG: NAD-dependent epimerase/dehydratase family protein [Pseudomonadota bacterium]
MTGADGFVGRHLVDALTRDGVAVRALDLRFGAPVPNGVETVIADIEREETIRSAMVGVNTVIHLAAVSDLWVPPGDPSRHHRINVEGTRIVLRSALAAGTRRFVYCSSNVTLIAGSRGVQSLDGTQRPPRDAVFGSYARSKIDAELAVEAAADVIETVIVRPGTPVGPGDHRPTPPGRLLRDLANGAVPALPSLAAINLVDVSVLARAIAESRYLAAPRTRYLLTGCDVSFGYLAELMAEITGLAMPRERVPYGVAWMAALAEDRVLSRWTGRMPKASFDGVRMAGRVRRFSAAAAHRDLGFQETDLRRSLTLALDWMAQSGMVERPLPGLSAALASMRR